jgi:hypothetical protein
MGPLSRRNINDMNFGFGSGADGRRPRWHYQIAPALPPAADPVDGSLVNGVVCHFVTRAAQQIPSYSITSSARASSVGGIVMPSAFAALKLTTSSNFEGC